MSAASAPTTGRPGVKRRTAASTGRLNACGSLPGTPVRGSGMPVSARAADGDCVGDEVAGATPAGPVRSPHAVTSVRAASASRASARMGQLRLCRDDGARQPLHAYVPQLADRELQLFLT